MNNSTLAPPVVVDRRVRPWATASDAGRRATDRVPYVDVWADVPSRG